MQSNNLITLGKIGVLLIGIGLMVISMGSGHQAGTDYSVKSNSQFERANDVMRL